MVRTEIFGFDPMLIFLAFMLGIIVLAFIILSNEDPLLVVINAGLLILATIVIGNLFEHSVYKFSNNFLLSVIHISIITKESDSLLLYLILDIDLVKIRTFVQFTMYIILGVVIFLTIWKGYNALRGGWKVLHKDQFKEK
ncbi:MAG: hypothetical protein ACFFDN_09475 [Candidatus Hodarchaeota archaeon]